MGTHLRVTVCPHLFCKEVILNWMAWDYFKKTFSQCLPGFGCPFFARLVCQVFCIFFPALFPAKNFHNREPLKQSNDSELETTPHQRALLIKEVQHYMAQCHELEFAIYQGLRYWFFQGRETYDFQFLAKFFLPKLLRVLMGEVVDMNSHRMLSPKGSNRAKVKPKERKWHHLPGCYASFAGLAEFRRVSFECLFSSLGLFRHNLILQGRLPLAGRRCQRAKGSPKAADSFQAEG